MTLWIDTTEIEKRALKIRQEHNIQTYGVKDIFSLMAQRDIDLIRYPFGKDIVLGFSTIFEGKKTIVSNSSEILSREIFTIAHELGHIIYDFEDHTQNIKIDVDINDIDENISEDRAFHFANCFLMPEEELLKFIKYELKKKPNTLNALDIVRIQIEFQVSYASAVMRLFKIKAINSKHKSELFNERNQFTSEKLFEMLETDKKLLKPLNAIKVPLRYLDYVVTNYENGYIPYSSLNKALALIGIDSKDLKKDDVKKDEELDIDDVFEEFE